MSCGSKACTAKILPRDRETAVHSSWLARVMIELGAMLEKSRRRQILFELEKAGQRGILKELDGRLLKDIGLTREQARREARKPFWQ
jgi:uncharacterized protein YjiS (DUF1127 family)